MMQTLTFPTRVANYHSRLIPVSTTLKNGTSYTGCVWPVFITYGCDHQFSYYSWLGFEQVEPRLISKAQIRPNQTSQTQQYIHISYMHAKFILYV